MLANLVRETVPSEGFARRALTVAFVLLGSVFDTAFALLDRSDAGDAAAWILGTVLADHERAPEYVRDVDRASQGAARRVTDRALARLSTGGVFSVVG